MKSTLRSLSAVVVFIFFLIAEFSCKNSVAPDTTPPTVVITYPVEGSTLMGPIKVITAVNDNVGVTSVSFFVDNLSVAKIQSAPFNFLWSVGFWADGGGHTLYAKATDAAGNVGTSQVVDVTIASSALTYPTIVGPTGDQFLDTTIAVLRWRVVPAAKQYLVQVTTATDTASPVFSASTKDTAVSASNLLLYADYIWRVCAVGPNGNRSGWSSGGSFTRLLPPPLGISPITGVYINNPQTVFRWSTVHRAVNYALSVSIDSLFDTTIFSETTVDTTAQSSGLPNVARLYWRVRSIAPGGIPGSWSQTFLFSRFNVFAKIITGQPIVAIQATADSGFILGGGNAITKIDMYGNKIWQNSYTGTIASIRVLAGGDILVGGVSSSQQAWALKTDGTGTTIWEKSYGPQPSSFLSADMLNDGNYLFCGVSGSAGWIVELNGTGDTGWTHTPGGGIIEYNGVSASHDGGALLAGSLWYTGYGYGISPAIFQKIDSSGTTLWTAEGGGCGPYSQMRGLSLQEYPDGSSLGFYYLPCAPTGTQAVKLDNSGGIVWNVTVAANFNNNGSVATWIEPLPNGEWVSCGYHSSTSVAIVQKFDGYGAQEWSRDLGLAFNAAVIVLAPDGGYLVGGGSQIVKTDPSGGYVGATSSTRVLHHHW